MPISHSPAEPPPSARAPTTQAPKQPAAARRCESQHPLIPYTLYGESVSKSIVLSRARLTCTRESSSITSRPVTCIPPAGTTSRVDAIPLPWMRRSRHHQPRGNTYLLPSSNKSEGGSECLSPLYFGNVRSTQLISDLTIVQQFRDIPWSGTRPRPG